VIVPVEAALGLLAGLVSIADGIPYIRDTVRGTTRPHRGTWFIWSSLALIALASQWADGAAWSLLMVAVQAVLTLTIFGLSLRGGEGRLSGPEFAMLAVAAAGVVGWYRSDSPVVATACVVLADAVGVLLMLPKTWRDPWSETLSAFVLAAASGLLGAGSVGTVDYSLLLYPAYFALGNGLVALIIVTRRRAAGR
jgi:hypothetical protein